MKKALLLLILIIYLTGCDDGVKPNQKTEVNGRVFDAVKNKHLANAKVVLISCKRITFGISCANPIDTTETDKDGNFSFTFKTKERDFGYEVEIAETESHTKDKIQPQSVTVEPGKINDITLHARELNYLVLTLQIRENTRPPLNVNSIYSNRRVQGINKDTTLLLKVLPQAKNQLIFTTTDFQTGRYRQRIDTLNIDIKDTTRYNVNLKVLEFKLK